MATRPAPITLQSGIILPTPETRRSIGADEPTVTAIKRVSSSARRVWTRQGRRTPSLPVSALQTIVDTTYDVYALAQLQKNG